MGQQAVLCWEERENALKTLKKTLKLQIFLGVWDEYRRKTSPIRSASNSHNKLAIPQPETKENYPWIFERQKS